jgi:hypothetical protein
MAAKLGTILVDHSIVDAPVFPPGLDANHFWFTLSPAHRKPSPVSKEPCPLTQGRSLVVEISPLRPSGWVSFRPAGEKPVQSGELTRLSIIEEILRCSHGGAVFMGHRRLTVPYRSDELGRIGKPGRQEY